MKAAFAVLLMEAEQVGADGTTEESGSKTPDKGSRSTKVTGIRAGKSRSRTRSKGRSQITSAKELLMDYVSDQAENADPKLRAEIDGSVFVEVLGGDERYLFDWSESELQVKELQDAPKSDCSIQISEKDLMLIYEGGLNPQVAMLSHKIRVVGKLGLAIYFFNLFAGQA